MKFPNEIPLSFEWIIIYFFGLFFLLLPIVAVVDILTGKFKKHGSKLRWFLAVLFLNVIGAVLYFAIGRKRRWKNN
jgi:hypothetical protein